MKDRELPYQVEATKTEGEGLGPVRESHGFPLTRSSTPAKPLRQKRGKYSKEVIRLLGHVPRRA